MPGPKFFRREERDGFDRVAKVAPELIEDWRRRESGRSCRRWRSASRASRARLPAVCCGWRLARAPFSASERIGLAARSASSKLGKLCDGGMLKDLDGGNFVPEARVIRRTMRTAASEFPPRSKKLSSMPISSSCSSSHQSAASCFSTGVCGAINSWARSGRLLAGLGKRLAIELGIRRQREFLQMHEGRRNHVVGQSGLERLDRASGAQAFAAGVVGNQALIAGRSSRRMTTACAIPSMLASAHSISPSSMRNPFSLTWWSRRPRNSSVPSGR